MVHTFEMHGLKLALDVESGALHILDDEAYAAVKKMDAGEFPSHAGEAVLAEINELKEKGLLFSERRHMHLFRDGVVKALCLHLAHDCNLRCKYCFAGTGHYGGVRGLMPLNVAKKAVDLLLTESRGRKHCEIDFFGGEPLLNFNVLRETVQYGRERAHSLGKVITFTVTTNALHLPEDVLAYLNREEISIVLSLDGREEVHNRMRPLPGGGKSWDRVMENCKAVVNGRDGGNYYLRGTYTRHNLDFSMDVKAMAAEGFKRISMEPAVLSPEAAESLREEDLPQLFAEYEKLAQYLWDRETMGEKILFFHFELNLDQGPCAKKRSQGCGAGSAYLAVTPDGKLYPCHQFAREAEFCAGDVDSGLCQEKLDLFAAVDSADKIACRNCFARFFCGGGCHAAAWSMNKDISKPYTLGCELNKKRVECGLYLQARRALAKISG
jgi:uncharacterized protein